MKKFLNFLGFVLIYIVPLVVIYFYIGKYMITITTSSIKYLEGYLYNLLHNVEKADKDYTKVFIGGILGFFIFKFINSKMMDRKSGLNLKERAGDWILTIWQLMINVGAWYSVFILSTYFKINTEAKLESTNIIFILVLIGAACNFVSTYLWYVHNMTRK